MGRRLFSREFKLEAVRLVRERGVSVVQASRDLDVGENVLRRWVKELSADPAQAFPGQGCQSALNSFQVTASKSFHLISPISAVSSAV